MPVNQENLSIQCADVDIINHGVTELTGSRDQEGHRTYKITYKIETKNQLGPHSMTQLADLPRPGDFWSPEGIGGAGEIDQFTWFTPELDIRQIRTNQPNFWWLVTLTASSQLQDRCNTKNITDPAMERPRVTGQFTKYSEEAVVDKDNKPILTSSHERLRGPQVEFDSSRPTIRIRKWMRDPNLSKLRTYKDTVNDAPLWGHGARQIKLGDISFHEKFYGKCQSIWEVSMEFEVNSKTWDRDVLDEGTKVLNGQWSSGGDWVLKNINGLPPNPANPAHFIRFQDKNHNLTTVILDGQGQPYDPELATTQACTQCTGGNGSPEKYVIYGFLDYLDGVEVTFSDGVVEGNCYWTADAVVNDFGDRSAKFNLLYDTILGKWNVNVFDPVTGLYDGWIWYSDPTADGAWKCQGTNLLYRTQVGAPPNLYEDPLYPAPDIISVKPKAPNEPGKIHIKKYESRNFLELGVPLNL